jgi:hypothetical protein
MSILRERQVTRDEQKLRSSTAQRAAVTFALQELGVAIPEAPAAGPIARNAIRGKKPSILD